MAAAVWWEKLRWNRQHSTAGLCSTPSMGQPQAQGAERRLVSAQLRARRWKEITLLPQRRAKHSCTAARLQAQPGPCWAQRGSTVLPLESCVSICHSRGCRDVSWWDGRDGSHWQWVSLKGSPGCAVMGMGTSKFGADNMKTEWESTEIPAEDS